MLNHPTLQHLRAMKLDGMAQAFQEQLEMNNVGDLSFEERLGLLVDRELTSRDNRSLARRLKNARLKQQGSFWTISIPAISMPSCCVRWRAACGLKTTAT